MRCRMQRQTVTETAGLQRPLYLLLNPVAGHACSNQLQLAGHIEVSMLQEGPSRSKSPRKYIFLGAAVVVAAGLWSAYWAAGRGVIADVLRNTVEVAQVEGGTLACAEQVLGGFPFRFELSCRPLQVADSRGNRLTVAGFRAVALAYNPKHLIAEADAPLEAVTTNSTSDTAPQIAGLELSAGWTLAQASVRVGEDSLTRLDAALQMPTIDLFGLGAAILSVKAGVAELHARRVDPAETAVDVALSLTGVASTGKLPVPDWPPVDVNLFIRLPYGAPLLAGGGLVHSLPAVLKTPDAIGITEFHLTGGEVELSAKGTLGVDAEGWLAGELPLTVVGAEKIAPALAPFFPAGSAVPQTLQGAVLALGKKTTLEEKPAVTVTVTFERGRARVGLIPIASLPKVL